MVLTEYGQSIIEDLTLPAKGTLSKIKKEKRFFHKRFHNLKSKAY